MADERVKRIVSIAAAAMLASCFGRIGARTPPGDGGGPTTPVDVYEPPPVNCAVPNAEPMPLYRITREQFDFAVADVLGFGAYNDGLGRAFAPDTSIAGFAVGSGMSALLAQQQMDAANRIAGIVVTGQPWRFTCDLAHLGSEDACATAAIDDFGHRLFRRELNDDDRARYLTVFHAGHDGAAYADGMQLVLEAMLRAPSFHYRTELDPAAGPPGEVVLLTPFETASRLALFLWRSVPDETLYEAARRSELSTPEQVETQARRMIADDRAHRAVHDFYRQWLRMDRMAALSKDSMVYGAFNSWTANQVTESLSRFIDHVTWDDGRFEQLFVSDEMYSTPYISMLYGLPMPSGTDWEIVHVDATQRLGILGHPGVLANFGKANQSDPIHRGVFVRTRLFCGVLGSPPNDIVIQVPQPTSGASTRERFASHTASPRCATCHTQIDPIGFGFERFDGMGAYRTMDNGHAVDSSGALTGTDVDGPFDSVPQLAQRIAQSQQVRACFAREWMRFALARAEVISDVCSQEQLVREWGAANYNLRELMVLITRTPAFRYRRAPVVGP